ncbi:hypothetical protein IB258_27085 [Achromobacter sp. ACM02]|nr:hypothetical protein [Achromobacter sp. ACM02]
MHKLRMKACGLMLTLAASGCTSTPHARPPVVECPKPEPPPAWVMEPAPNLIQLLDRITSPFEPGSDR